MSGERVDTWGSHRKKVLQAYGWIGDSSPFNYSNDTECLFTGGHQPLSDLQALFTDFLIECQHKKVALALQTTITSLDIEKVEQLKRACLATGNYKTIDQFIRFYITLQRDFQELTRRIRVSTK